MRSRLASTSAILTALVAGFALGVTLAMAAPQAPCPPAGDTMSLLQPQSPGYSEAQEFGRFLESHHISLRCITGTTIGSYFLGETKSAAFQTDLGPVSVVFFPPPYGAERVTITLKVTQGHYRYTFRTRQPGLRGHQVMESDAPFHLLIKGPWFIFTSDPRVEERLRLALAGY